MFRIAANDHRVFASAAVFASETATRRLEQDTEGNPAGAGPRVRELSPRIGIAIFPAQRLAALFDALKPSPCFILLFGVEEDEGQEKIQSEEEEDEGGHDEVMLPGP